MRVKCLKDLLDLQIDLLILILNDNEARANNNGAYPPDLSVITKARKYGEDYIYNLLMGYEEAPEGLEVGNGMYYNKWMAGNQIAMPAPNS